MLTFSCLPIGDSLFPRFDCSFVQSLFFCATVLPCFHSISVFLFKPSLFLFVLLPPSGEKAREKSQRRECRFFWPRLQSGRRGFLRFGFLKRLRNVLRFRIWIRRIF